MNQIEAEEMAREVVAGKARSYVAAAQRLAEFIIAEADTRKRLTKALEESHRIQREGNRYLDEPPDEPA